MTSFGGLVLRPWIRELVLGSDALSSPRAGQLLKVSSAPPRHTHPSQSPETWAGPQGGGFDAGRRPQVLQEAKAQSPSGAPDPPDAEAMLLVSDGTHSIRCLVTGEALNASDW